ncbi:MAG TPA: DNA gyrase inhibitor YacG [Terriglobales bacterium]|jgi:hypothetical protein
MAKRLRSVRCPICKQKVRSDHPDFPFCSERCRTVDLGKWASGAYVITSPIKDTSEEMESETGLREKE